MKFHLLKDIRKMASRLPLFKESRQWYLHCRWDWKKIHIVKTNEICAARNSERFISLGFAGESMADHKNWPTDGGKQKCRWDIKLLHVTRKTMSNIKNEFSKARMMWLILSLPLNQIHFDQERNKTAGRCHC